MIPWPLTALHRFRKPHGRGELIDPLDFADARRATLQPI